ncbi:transcriptional regulator [Kitasatospora paranensis]|uniref:Transcriptional regulator n=1 Tax=Kitasatospora paranensis TaxID=258053 RepID=A0ABW2FXE8_9ACTN
MQPALRPDTRPVPRPVADALPEPVAQRFGRLPRRHRSGFAPATVFEAALTDLSADRATGALHGSAGTVHLVAGEVVHAESPAASDVAALLTSAGRISARTWADSVAGARGAAADHLVATGLIGRGELELCQLTAVMDAAYFALPQNDGPIGFLPGVRPALTLGRPLNVGTLRLGAGRRRTLLDRTWPAPQLDDAPVRPRTQSPWTERQLGSCSGRRRAVLAAADGYRTPTQIARLLGRSAFTTLLDIRHLAAAGLIEVPLPRTGSAPAAVTVRARHRAPGPALPPGAEPATAPSAPGTPAGARAPFPSSGPAVPRRVPLQAGPSPARAEVLLPPLGSSDIPPDPEIALLLRIRAALEARL